MREREREREGKGVCVCVCERERESEGGREILTKLKQKTILNTITKHAAELSLLLCLQERASSLTLKASFPSSLRPYTVVG